MVGRTKKSDVKSRLGERKTAASKPTRAARAGRIRDARDILRKKVPAKTQTKPSAVSSLNTKDRVRRLMPVELLSAKAKSDATKNQATSKKVRTLRLSSGSLQITTKRPELCRKAVVSQNSLQIVTPSRTIIDDKESSAATTSSVAKTSSAPTTRTLRNDLFTVREQRNERIDNTPLETTDLRASTSKSSSFAMGYIPTPIRKPLTTGRADMNQQNLTKIVVTNLHPRVVQEDIAELFGAVGLLTYVKLQHCVAEVVFAKAVHADIAYRKYHNRMLDGQAMKCTLGLADMIDPTPVQISSDNVRSQESLANKGTRLNYSGVDLVYPQTPSRPVVFQVRI